MILLPDFLRDLTTNGLSSFSSSEPLPDDAETEAVVLREGFDLLLLEPGDPDTWSVDMWTAGDLFVGERTPTPLVGDGAAPTNLHKGNRRSRKVKSIPASNKKSGYLLVGEACLIL